MRLIKSAILSLLILYIAPYAIEATPEDIRIGLTTYPEEPLTFQPSSPDQPTRVIVEVKNASTGELLKDVRVGLKVVHLKGRGILTTGFPHMEGKMQISGDFHLTDGRLEFDYIFPVRGDYKIDVIVEDDTDLSSRKLEPVIEEELKVRVREQFFEIRNAAILFLTLFSFGFIIGLVYGRGQFRIGG